MNAPDTIKAGFTYEWEEEFSDYPSSEYSLSVTFVLLTSAATTKTIAGTVSGAGFALTLTSAVSTDMTAGDYQVITYAVKNSNKYILSEKACTVFANPLSTSGDQRSHARIVLDAINSVIEGRATAQTVNLSIDGATLSMMSHEDLWKMKMRYEILVSQEDERAKIKAGGKPRNKIIPRFQ